MQYTWTPTNQQIILNILSPVNCFKWTDLSSTWMATVRCFWFDCNYSTWTSTKCVSVTIDLERWTEKKETRKVQKILKLVTFDLEFLNDHHHRHHRCVCVDSSLSCSQGYIVTLQHSCRSIGVRCSLWGRKKKSKELELLYVCMGFIYSLYSAIRPIDWTKYSACEANSL